MKTKTFLINDFSSFSVVPNDFNNFINCNNFIKSRLSKIFRRKPSVKLESDF